MQNNFIIPNWPSPTNIKAVTTTRSAGNLALHVGDNPSEVKNNRRQLTRKLQLPAPPVWLNQVHTTNVFILKSPHHTTPTTADATYSRMANQVCAVLTADCLPLLVTDQQGKEIAAIHAGWRGLAGGIIDQTLVLFKAPPTKLLVWLGPAIGPKAFEVGKEVRDVFLHRHADYQAAFILHKNRWLANIYHLAKINLSHLDLHKIYGGEFCTYQDNTLFYSYRREKGQTGRMATLIWRDNHPISK